MADSAAPALPGRWLVVGLGNPGEEYSGTPHNLGFQVVDRLAGAHGIRVTQPDSKALAGKGRIGGKPVMLAKPQTFMNLSGGSVRLLFDKYDIGLSELVLVYDELALPWMNVRVRRNGSSAGHNGVESVIRSLGSSDFARVRIGIHPGHPIRDGAQFVLAPFGRAQKQDLDTLLDTSVRAVEFIISEGVDKAMAMFNRRAQGAKEEE
ncbi:MAG: aminoacyl-tRNA hydrolase [Acidobacteria bacterium]|nr:aminoacyl-tRNA hydrolase [Acidobacteriota bacterium]